MATRAFTRKTSVQLLLDSDGRGDAEVVIRAKARELVDRAMALGWPGPPFDVTFLADLRDIRVESELPTLVEDAMLVSDPVTGQFTIRISKSMPVERQRFSIGHEISHTFFPDCAEAIQLRSGRLLARDSMLESLCDIGAAEMLLPLGPFVRDAADFGGPTLAAVAQLRERYLASWEATANRLVATAEEACAMLVLRLRLKPREERNGRYIVGLEPTPKLRVDYSVTSKAWAGLFRFVPPHKSVGLSSSLYGLVDQNIPRPAVMTIEDWADVGLGLVRVEGMLLPTDRQTQKILVLLRPAS